jgi:hypothetical protein
MAGRGISGSGVSRPSSGMSAWRGVSRPAKAVVGAVRGVRLVSMALSRRVDPAFGFVCARIMYARRHREQFASGFSGISIGKKSHVGSPGRRWLGGMFSVMCQWSQRARNPVLCEMFVDLEAAVSDNQNLAHLLAFKQ